jgi:glycosyltransferase involved in cell wall biosynthesis
MIMRILYFSPLENACTYYRCTLPARHLKRQGLAETRLVGTVAKEYFDWADIVVIQRSVGELMEKVVQYCRIAGKKVVYELDDNLFCYPDSIEYVKSGLQEQTISALKILRKCHAVTTTTQGIADTIKELVDTPVHILPNCLDFEDVDSTSFHHLHQVRMGDLIMRNAECGVRNGVGRVGSAHHSAPHCTIGWAGGHYHVQDLGLIEPALIEVMGKHPHVQAIFYGDCPARLYETYPDRVFYQPWTGLEDFYMQMSILRFDVGLAPLYPTEFARSRSPLRLLQYAALGIPIVGSNYGEYGKLLSNGLPGALVGWALPTATGRALPTVLKSMGWAETLSWMIEHPEERQDMASRARQYVRENYDIKRNVHKWAEVYYTLRR